MNNEQVDKALRIACGHDEVRPVMSTPFSCNGWNIATDAHIILAAKGEPMYARAESKAAKPIDERCAEWAERVHTPARDMTITAEQVREAMSQWPMVDDYNEVECSECNGSGSVECECHCGDQHDRDCETCKGTGSFKSEVPSGKIPHPAEKVSTGGFAAFGPQTWPKLALIVEALDIKELRVTNGSNNGMVRMEAVDMPVVLVLMPVMTYANEKFFYTIP
jgi:hypothetical protein